jgi:hypothetical protein
VAPAGSTQEERARTRETRQRCRLASGGLQEFGAEGRWHSSGTPSAPGSRFDCLPAAHGEGAGATGHRGGTKSVLIGLSRQIEPGSRVRTFLYQPTDLPAPDDEAVVHAMFDLVAQGEPGEIISEEELAALITKYAAFRESRQ